MLFTRQIRTRLSGLALLLGALALFIFGVAALQASPRSTIVQRWVFGFTALFYGLCLSLRDATKGRIGVLAYVGFCLMAVGLALMMVGAKH